MNTNIKVNTNKIARVYIKGIILFINIIATIAILITSVNTLNLALSKTEDVVGTYIEVKEVERTRSSGRNSVHRYYVYKYTIEYEYDGETYTDKGESNTKIRVGEQDTISVKKSNPEKTWNVSSEDKVGYVVIQVIITVLVIVFLTIFKFILKKFASRLQ